MTKLVDRLRAAREAMGLGQVEFAARAGVAQQRIADIESGKVTSPRKWENIAEAARIDREEFRRLIMESSQDAGRQRIARAVQSGPAPNGRILGPAPEISRRRIPVYGQAVGGALGEYVFNGEVIDTVICPPGLENVPNAYAVFVDGDSMEPRYEAGETVWVHPNRPPRRGDDVVVQIAHDLEGEPPHGYIKRFVGWTGSKLKLTQFNPAQEVTFSRDQVISVHPIVFAQKT